ncbi:hypothetical protein D9756_010933 [Leucocoprinus leucothites]|uniref:Uncharacterized protein n=1 Tax=Leucocoprinus leucothites TaxID=201217 RepID=A0A8H5FR27_9AGAR|nr:hypothetical protein D9756_010933 [Leucoagaricus leucothites]
MLSIKKVKNWYAQSFEELITFPLIQLSPSICQALMVPWSSEVTLPESTPNPSLKPLSNRYTNLSHGLNGGGNGNSTNSFNKLWLRVPME